MTGPTSPSPTWPVKYGLLVLVWGSSFLLMKLALAALAPVQVAAARIVCGAAVVLALHAASPRSRLPDGLRTWAHVAVTAVFLGPVPFTLFPLSETRVSSALAGIANAITPVASAALAMAFLPADRPGRAQRIGTLVGFLGVVVVAEPWSTGRPDALGLLMALAAGVSYAIGWTWSRRHLTGLDLGPYGHPAATLIVSAALMVPVLLGWWWTQRGALASPLALGGPGTTDDHGTSTAVLAVIALGVVGTGLAYRLQFDVVRDAGPVVATSVTYLIPIVSVLLGVLVLGEHLGLAQLAGFVVVLTGALLIGRGRR